MTAPAGSRIGGILVGVAAAVVGAAVIAGIAVLGPPSAQRQQRLDLVRVRDLATIERLVSSFAILHKSLPRDLSSLAHEPGYSVPRGDPESGRPYEYEVLQGDSYRLCATFTTRTSQGTPDNPYGGAMNETWTHDIGRQCFNRRANLEPRAQER